MLIIIICIYIFWKFKQEKAIILSQEIIYFYLGFYVFHLVIRAFKIEVTIEDACVCNKNIPGYTELISG